MTGLTASGYGSYFLGPFADFKDYLAEKEFFSLFSS
jgi:hypothetical protein